MSNKLATSNQRKQKKQLDTQEIFKSIIEYILAVIGIGISILVPLYLQDGYHEVGTCKYAVYQVIVVVGFILAILATIVYWLKMPAETETDISKTDISFVAFILLAFVAALAGGNFSRCVSGYNGWNMGLIALFTFGLLYYYFSRFGRYYKAVLVCLFGATFIAMFLGVMHRMMIDLIGTYGLGTVNEIADNYKNQFLSTLGQATWYSSFVCTVLPLGIGLFYASKNRRMRIVFGIFTVLGFMTMVTQNSDSAYMALFGFMMVFFWFSVYSIERMERFFELCMAFVWATRLMQILFWIHPNEVLKLDSISTFVVFSSQMWFIAVLVTAVWAMSYYCMQKQIFHKDVWNVARYVAVAMTLIGVVTAGIILYLSAQGKLSGAMLTLSQKVPYLEWSEKWGNGRGGTWAFSFQMIADMGIINKLFGVGPDGYAPYAYTFYSARLQELWGARTLSNAHNEWLNSIISYGFIGTIAYVGIFVTAIAQFAKEQLSKTYMIGFVACIVSYMCHNFFCYQQVCCTPFVFMLIGIGIYIVRSEGELATDNTREKEWLK